jgi:hypothetical protein
MRSLPCVAALLLAALPLWAAEEPKPNSLTPKEAAEGWVLLFDGQTTFGWNIEGEAKVQDGVLVLGRTKATKAATTTAFDWGNSPYALEMELRWDGPTSPTFLLLGGMVGLTDAAKTKFIPQKVTVTANSQFPPPPRMPQKFEVPAGSKLFVRNLKYRPLGMKPLFNGKDLTGWKKFEAEPARAKSQFSVNERGELCIKNGPGDLQTTGAWGDFVLQIECMSNGKHLNSGVFFRCQPDKYQQGYEAQIQNGFTKDPPWGYLVEEYDPQTHESRGKKTVKSAADDYGTGAIYRRVPARFAVARDHEWFTMTVAASGRHIATWVNGIQQVDWTDNRPLNDNARNGCRLDKGPISLQGHDATTDLCFRNIRIQELPPAEKK